MRRALLWTAVCLLIMASAALIAAHVKVRPESGVVLEASRAARRAHERMHTPWPEGDIDINTAGALELERLFGVGEVMAQRIIQERETNGPFVYPEDLLNVSGIGSKTLAKLWEQIRLPDPTNQ